MSKLREIIYISVIGVLLLTLAGMYYYPRPSPEPIIYYTTAAGEVLSSEDEEVQLLEEGLESPFIAPNNGSSSKNGSSAKKPAPKKAKAPSPPGKITAAEGRININIGSISQLKRLPGIGDVTAQKIIDYRDTHGEFTRIEDIMKVNGIGKAKFDAMKDLIEI